MVEVYQSVNIDIEETTQKDADHVIEYFLLHKGRQNARPLNTINNEIGLSPAGNSAYFRKICTELVCNGFPILSCSSGYFLAETKEEVLHTIEQEKKRLRGVQRRINALYSAFARFGGVKGQLTLF